MFSNNTAKNFSQRANKYNYAILRGNYFQSILANISSTKQWKLHRQFRSYKCKKIQNKDEKHLPWILCRGLGMFLKQLDQFMLQYYYFKAENIAKQQKCWELWTSQIATTVGLDCDVRKFPIQLFYNPATYQRRCCSICMFADCLQCHSYIGGRPRKLTWAQLCRYFDGK
jgi:hypothetical protein